LSSSDFRKKNKIAETLAFPSSLFSLLFQPPLRSCFPSTLHSPPLPSPRTTKPLQAAALFASLRWASAWFSTLDAESLLAVAAAVEASTSLSSSSSSSETSSRTRKKTPTAAAPTSPSLFDEPTRSVSVIVPAYNEEQRLPLALDEALAFLDSRRDRLGPSFSFEVVIVDDGSSDGTSRVAEAYAKRRGGPDAVRLVRMEKNSGKGAAVRAGALGARGARLLMMDADGATKVSDLDRLDEALDALVAEELEKRRKRRKGASSGGGGAKVLASSSAAATTTTSTAATADAAAFAFASPALPPAWAIPAAALGSRAHLAPGVAAKRAAHRNFLMRGFRLLVSAVAGDSVKDTQCGFKLFTRSAARVLFGNQRLQRWCFDVELVHLATSRLESENESGEKSSGGGSVGSLKTSAVPLAEVAVNWQEIPGSKVRVSSILHMAFEMGAIMVGYGTGAWVARGEGELVEAAREFAGSSTREAKKVA